MSFLKLEGKTFLVVGVANRKSVAYSVAKTLEEEGAKVIYSVRSPKRRDELGPKLLKDRDLVICDLERQEDIDQLAVQIAQIAPQGIDGLLHSVAFANYSEGMKPFHHTVRKDFLQAVDISCFSLVALVKALESQFKTGSSIVTVSISTTRMASENYGYMAPVKAALDSSVVFLAKALASRDIRVNAVGASLLKTSASAGIPGYLDSYLFAEKVIPRGKALQTEEAADAATYLLSPRSSGINARTLVVDAGMEINYFDKDVVAAVAKSLFSKG